MQNPMQVKPADSEVKSGMSVLENLLYLCINYMHAFVYEYFHTKVFSTLMY